jgi:hypothetical protein
MDLKEDLENLMALFIFIGILLFIIQGLIYLNNLISNPLWDLNIMVGNILINTLGKLPILISIAIILFIAGMIIQVGASLKDEYDQSLYTLLTYLFWILDVIILFIFGLAYLFFIMPNNGNNSISITPLIGLEFLLFIAPPYVFVIIKGIIYLIRFIKENGQ